MPNTQNNTLETNNQIPEFNEVIVPLFKNHKIRYSDGQSSHIAIFYRFIIKSWVNSNNVLGFRKKNDSQAKERR